jgi:hypothetical protein
MFKMKKKRAVFIMVLALSLLAVISPLPVVSALPSTGETNAEVKRDALKVVSSILKSVSGLRSPTNRIKLRSLGVALIATSDQNLARTSCQEMESDFAELYSAAGGGNPDETTLQTVDLLRVEAVRTIADVDPTMALEVLHSTGAQAQHPTAPSGPEDAELEAYVAGQLIDKDPRAAYEIIRGSPTRSFSSLLPDLLQRLGAHDMAMAKDAAAGLADSLMRADLAGRQDAFFTAVGLINVTHTIGEDRTGGQDAGEQLLTREKEAKLINKLVTAATGQRGLANGLAPQLADMIVVAADVAPESAAVLRRELESPRHDAASKSTGGSDFWERVGDRTVAEAVELIAGEHKDGRSALYQQAALRALAAGNPTLAKGIAERFIVSPNDRQEILSQISREEVLREINAGDTTTVRSQLAQMAPEERALLLIEAAKSFQIGKDVTQPLNLLEEARVALSSQPRSVVQLKLRLQLAEAFMRFDAVRAGNILEGIVAQLNNVLSAATALDGYLSDGPILKDGELDLANSSAIVGMYQAYVQALASLAPYDYQRAQALADQLQPLEAQMMARLLVAKGVLGQAVPYAGDRVG